MSLPAETGATRAEVPPPDPRDASPGELVGQLGAGLSGGAGVVALLGVNALVTVIVLALANALPAETVASVQQDIATVKDGVSR